MLGLDVFVKRGRSLKLRQAIPSLRPQMLMMFLVAHCESARDFSREQTGVRVEKKNLNFRRKAIDELLILVEHILGDGYV